MNFTNLTMGERANLCLNIYQEEGVQAPKCSDTYNENRDCGYICCGHCPDYADCTRGKCSRVWIDPGKVTKENPTGRIYYVVLETGMLVSGSIPCIISEMYDDNE